MPIIFKTKKCTDPKCKHDGKEQTMSQFHALRGNSITDTCLTCRTTKKGWKDEHKEDVADYNEHYKNGTLEERKQTAVKQVSPKRKENQIIDGVEHSWCSGKHKSYLPVSNFTRDSSTFTGLRRSCKVCTNTLKNSGRQK